MPDLSGIVGDAKSSWVDEIGEIDPRALPPTTETILGNTKIVTLYRHNEEGKKVRVIRTYRIERKMISHAVAQRKLLSKFGECAHDKPGPDPGTTIIAEEVTMHFVANKEESEKDVEQTALEKLKASNKGIVRCRICKEDHWTTQCPYKDTLVPLKDPEKQEIMATSADQAASSGPLSTGKYVPPSRREGAVPRERFPDSSGRGGRNDETSAIRVSNLSESTQEQDLQDLFKSFGNICRIFLAKDKNTGQCKGFAFINYYHKDDASKAISTLHGYGYDHLILNVEWAKPSAS